MADPDFEDPHWTTLARQFQAYRKQHPRSQITSIADFASNIINNPSHYKESTNKRAISYNKRRTKGSEIPIASSEIEDPSLKGGKLSAKEVKKMVQSSYDKKNQDFDDFDVDHELSGDKVKVYRRKNSKQAVVVHRGTQGLGDIALDFRYILGQDINNSDRAKHAREIQEKAEAKYGKDNTTTVGHSLGSKLSSLVGNNSHEIINVNKAVAPQDLFKKIDDKETNIRTKYDPVSALMALKGHKNTFTIPSTTINPLAEHSTDALDRIEPDQMFGKGKPRRTRKSIVGTT